MSAARRFESGHLFGDFNFSSAWHIAVGTHHGDLAREDLFVKISAALLILTTFELATPSFDCLVFVELAKNVKMALMRKLWSITL